MSEWLNNLTDEGMRGDETLKRFDDVDALAKSYLEIRKAQGRAIQLPTDAADDALRAENAKKIMKHHPNMIMIPDPDKPWGEQPDEFKAMFGVPENAEGYTPPADFKGMPKEMLQSITDVAVKVGMNRTQWETFANLMAEDTEATQGMLAQHQEENSAKLKARLGLAHDESVEGVKGMFVQFQDEALPIDPESPLFQAIVNDPGVMLALNSIRKNAFAGGGGNGQTLAAGDSHKSLDELKAEWADLERTEENRLFMLGRLPSDRRKAHHARRMKLREAMTQTQV
jgi:hypothetical protein